jgi:small-conductance mechanosensitive channel
MNNWKGVSGIFSWDVSRLNLPVRLGIGAAFIVIQSLLIWALVAFFRWLQKKVTFLVNRYIPSLTIKKFHILETAQILRALYFLIKILKWVVIVIWLFLTVPLLLGLFEPTQQLAGAFLGHILTPLKNILIGIINYIPNLITIVVFIIVARYTIKALNFFTIRIERGKLVIPGFYPEWAQPTSRILHFLIYAFTVAVIYPYLPGADSRVFQGVSVFVGIIISFSSGPAIGNLVAGLVLTYMRSFKLGDRVQIQNVTGFVVEKSPVIVRLRTHKNEYVTFPNSMVLTSSIINYHTSSTEQGLILNAEITFAYAMPWQTVHEILIAAALKTANIMEEPKPFVLQTALEDFYARYQINAYTKAIDFVPATYSELFVNIQNGFREAGLDMTASHFRINILEQRPENRPARS